MSLAAIAAGGPLRIEAARAVAPQPTPRQTKSDPFRWSDEFVGKAALPCQSVVIATLRCAGEGLLLATRDQALARIQKRSRRGSAENWCTWVRGSDDEDAGDAEFVCTNGVVTQGVADAAPFRLGALCVEPPRAPDESMLCGRFRVGDARDSEVGQDSRAKALGEGWAAPVLDTWTGRVWRIGRGGPGRLAFTQQEASAVCEQAGGARPSLVHALEYVRAMYRCRPTPEEEGFFAWTGAPGKSEGTGVVIDHGGLFADFSVDSRERGMCTFAPPRGRTAPP